MFMLSSSNMAELLSYRIRIKRGAAIVNYCTQPKTVTRRMWKEERLIDYCARGLSSSPGEEEDEEESRID